MGQIAPTLGGASNLVSLVWRRGRFRVPADVLSQLRWGAEGAVPLIAEVVAGGHVRLWLDSEIRPWLEEQAADLTPMEQDSLEDRIAAGEGLRGLWDRFRPTTLTKAGRVELARPIMVLLEPDQSATQLFIELGSSCVEVFSRPARLRRIRHSRQRAPFPPVD